MKEVRTGSDPKMIVIILHRSGSTDKVFTWDIKRNIEYESYDVPKRYEMLWDRNGHPYIVMDNCIKFAKETCAIKSYDY